MYPAGILDAHRLLRSMKTNLNLSLLYITKHPQDYPLLPILFPCLHPELVECNNCKAGAHLASGSGKSSTDKNAFLIQVTVIVIRTAD